ncbi:uncharacterized protein [Spinacia oleracea]|uniref:DNA helicase Pif1-like 2B domain-containing protein n=1 Tax=Spinacia oleracea TaxID=3562 RepID=A0A9R0K486_SPIOL|nr:uncharacterized protein LOC110796242 [Spinacia oleracea]
MAWKENVESLDMVLRDLCDENLLFGGKLIMFGGNGELQTIDNSLVHLPSEVVKPLEDGKDPITDLTTLTFPALDLNSFSSDIFTTKAILTPMNDDVDSVNMDLIKKFSGEPVVYRSFDTMLDDNCNVYPIEFINTLCPSGMSPHELILKMGSPVILLRNILPSSGLCNGTRLICKGFFPNLIQCVIITGHHKGKHVFIPRIKLRPASSSKYPILFQRKQFPIKLSFAMTINKSQGQTLSQVAVYLPRPCFSHGQLYVALSRARQASQVTVISRNSPQQLPGTEVENVISYDVLRLPGGQDNRSYSYACIRGCNFLLSVQSKQCPRFMIGLFPIILYDTSLLLDHNYLSFLQVGIYHLLGYCVNAPTITIADYSNGSEGILKLIAEFLNIDSGLPSVIGFLHDLAA